MKYAYHDLGHQDAGTTVRVRLEGSVANVLLLDPTNFGQYRAGLPFRYSGGHFTRSPVELEIPEGGHWYVVVDTGGYRGRVRGHVEVVSPRGARAPGTLVEA